MILEKMDSIVCNAVFGQGLPVHFYLKFLNYGINCLREINMDIMRNVITTKIPLTSYKAAKIPCDFLDWTEIGVEVGQYVRALPQKQNLNPLKNYDSSGMPIPYPSIETLFPDGVESGLYPYYYLNGYLNMVNQYGENKGGVFGYGGGTYPLSFQYMKDRGEIQLDVNFPCDHIVLKYISDGFDKCGCDTLVNPYAYDTIKNYIIWQYHLNTKTLMKAAPLWEQQFDNALRILRGRMNPITPQDILMILRKNYKATIKN